MNPLDSLLHPKTNKPIQYKTYFNDWLVQVVVENKIWSTCYYKRPPYGEPEIIVSSKHDAQVFAEFQAFLKTKKWIQDIVQQSAPAFNAETVTP